MRNTAQNLCLVGAAILIFIAALEIGLRLVGYNKPMVYAYSPHTGTRIRSHIIGWVENEASVFVRTDALGLRVKEEETPERQNGQKPGNNHIRIALLGDSYTESHHVAHEESFPYLIERSLAACIPPYSTVDVLNFAVSGYNNVQALQSFRHRARAFAPDVVLLVFHANNDLAGNYRKLEKNPYIPYAEFKNGALKLDLSFESDEGFQRKLKWSNLRNDISNRVRILQLATNAFGAFVNWRARTHRGSDSGGSPAPTSPLPTESSATKPPERNFDYYFSVDYEPTGLAASGEHHPPRNGFQEMLWQLAESVISRLGEDVQATGASFWLTATATGVAISPKDQGPRTNDVSNDYGYATFRLSQFAESNGIPFVPLGEALRQKAMTSGRHLEYFREKKVYGHWNALGHATVAETLSKALCPHLKERLEAKQTKPTKMTRRSDSN